MPTVPFTPPIARSSITRLSAPTMPSRAAEPSMSAPPACSLPSRRRSGIIVRMGISSPRAGLSTRRVP